MTSATGGENAGLGGGGDQVRTGDTSGTKLGKLAKAVFGEGELGSGGSCF